MKKPQELTIKTLPVEIKVIRIGGHKMTLAVWQQIPEYEPFYIFGAEPKVWPEVNPCAERLQKLIAANNIVVHGWVSRPSKRPDLTDTDTYLFFTKDGQLYKCMASTSFAESAVWNICDQLYIGT